MKKCTFVLVLFLSAASVFMGCGKDDYKPGPVLIEGLTLENFPVLDGSTSTDPLVNLLAARLLGYNAAWERKSGYETWNIETNLPKKFVERRLKCSQTHGSIMNLIDGGADMIFSARTPSPDEKTHADNAGITLVETPIALDALIFTVNESNAINSLTHEQLQDIYTAKIKNWTEVGGTDMEMIPFVRNRNSGSQELMESLVMTEPIPDGFWEDYFEGTIINGMIPVFSAVSGTPGGLGYTIYFFKENMIRDNRKFQVKTIVVNEVYPNEETIGNRTYPFTAPVYLMIRSDLDQSSMAYKIYEYMQTEAGKRIVSESGYIPN